MRLIFHLSHNFSEHERSFNFHIDQNMRSVKYRDLNYAIKTCIQLSRFVECFEGLYLSKSDLTLAFRLIPARKDNWQWMLMMAKDPETHEVKYFVEKCLPFGASSSCFIFQCFSNTLCHLVEELTGKAFQVTNYLDDFLFVEKSKEGCDRLVTNFLKVCSDIGCPVSQDKSEWSTQRLISWGY